MRSFLHCAALLALLGVLASCTDDGGASPMEASDFCDAYVDAFCDGFESCCDSQVAGFQDCRGAASAYCEQVLLTVDDRGVAPTGANAPARIVFDFDEEGAGAAIARVESVFSSCKGDPEVSFGDTHFLGEPGAECLNHSDCFEGMRCEHPPRAVFGTCVFAPLEGQACSDICASWDLTCAEDRGDLVCVAPRKEGESCGNEVLCERGLRCVDAWLSGPGGGGGEFRCEPLGAEGDGCGFDYDCASYSCSGGRCSGGGTEDNVCVRASFVIRIGSGTLDTSGIVTQ